MPLAVKRGKEQLTNILLEYYDIGAEWLRPALGKHLHAGQKAVVIAFSFRDSQVRTHEEFLALYGQGGKYHEGISDGLTSYGIRREDIAFVDYFADTPETAAEKLVGADIVYLPGGLPDRMLDRIREFGLEERIRRFPGILIGYSAGAMVQLGEYHISPDEDYPEFVYREGLGVLDGFYFEPHYEGNPEQDEAIRRVLRERGRPVYATAFASGAIIIEDGKMETVGDVRVFRP